MNSIYLGVAWKWGYYNQTCKIKIEHARKVTPWKISLEVILALIKFVLDLFEKSSKTQSSHSF